jgi:two-component system sporulation sensor kinase B
MGLLIFIIALLWLVAGLLLFANHQRKTNLWYSAFLFVLSLGYFVAMLKDFIIPNFSADADALSLVARFLSAFGYRVCPYLLLMVGISYSERFSSAMTRLLSFWLLVPVFFSFGLDLIFPGLGFLSQYIQHGPLFWATEIWAIPYGLFANGLLFHAFLIEQHPKLRSQRLLVFLVTSPTLVNLVISYKPNLLHIKHMWCFTMWPVLVLVPVSLTFLVRYGLLGLRITLERTTVDNTVKAMTSGTSLLNHAIKNELQVISAGLDTLKSLEQDERRLRIVDTIAQASRRLLEMTTRIQGRIQESAVLLEYCSLNRIVEESLERIRLTVTEQKIHVTYHPLDQAYAYCDRTLILEVLNNLYKNAIEAMPGGGWLDVYLFSYKKYAMIQVKDTGVGIPKPNLARVIEPFFTTKPFGANYGLGLTYCYNVLQKHGGDLEIQSVAEHGTTVTLRLPNRSPAPLRGTTARS